LEEEAMDKNRVGGSTAEINGTGKRVPSLALALLPRLLVISAGQAVTDRKAESGCEVDKAKDAIPSANGAPNDLFKGNL
jgi:hypothetical protein